MKAIIYLSFLFMPLLAHADGKWLGNIVSCVDRGAGQKNMLGTPIGGMRVTRKNNLSAAERLEYKKHGIKPDDYYTKDETYFSLGADGFNQGNFPGRWIANGTRRPEKCSDLFITPLPDELKENAAEAATRRDKEQKIKQEADRISAMKANMEFHRIEAAKPFNVLTSGIVRDNRTGLEWLRCPVGSEWDENKRVCTGTTYHFMGIKSTQEEVKKINQSSKYAGYSDWRVPTVRELISLRYCSTGEGSFVDLEDGNGTIPSRCNEKSIYPSISQEVFPLDKHFSSFGVKNSSNSPKEYPGRVWEVNMYYGTIQVSYGGQGPLLLVRGTFNQVKSIQSNVSIPSHPTEPTLETANLSLKELSGYDGFGLFCRDGKTFSALLTKKENGKWVLRKTPQKESCVVDQSKKFVFETVHE